MTLNRSQNGSHLPTRCNAAGHALSDAVEASREAESIYVI